MIIFDYNIVFENECVSRNDVFNVDVGYIATICCNSDGVVECSRGFIENADFFYVGLAWFGVFKDDVTFNRIAEFNLFCARFEFCVIAEMETDIGRGNELGIIGVRLIEIDCELAVGVEIVNRFDRIQRPLNMTLIENSPFCSLDTMIPSGI